jgi:aspartate 1-decarboxylase
MGLRAVKSTLIIEQCCCFFFFVRRIFKSKIHRATVTQADLHYEGSLTIDHDLMRAADILPYEEVHVWNVSRGTRLSTYAIIGEAGSGVICANGAAAHHIGVGDVIIIATFILMQDVPESYTPTVVRVDAQNRLLSFDPEVAGPRTPHIEAC